MEHLKSYLNTKNLIGFALGSFLLTSKSKLLRYGALLALVVVYFVLPSDNKTGREVREGIADLTERWPGIGGMASRWAVKK